ncbi:MAG: hypothetical protein ACREGH_02435 [Minisyncoccia bacterium]
MSDLAADFFIVGILIGLIALLYGLYHWAARPEGPRDWERDVRHAEKRRSRNGHRITMPTVSMPPMPHFKLRFDWLRRLGERPQHERQEALGRGFKAMGRACIALFKGLGKLIKGFFKLNGRACSAFFKGLEKLIKGVFKIGRRACTALFKGLKKLIKGFFKLGVPVVAGAIAFVLAFSFMTYVTHDPVLSAGVSVIAFAVVWLTAVRGFNSDDPRHMSDVRLKKENERMEAEDKYKERVKKRKEKTGIDKEIEDAKKEEELARLRARAARFGKGEFVLRDGGDRSNQSGG